jgi:hypothetical protein
MNQDGKLGLPDHDGPESEAKTIAVAERLIAPLVKADRTRKWQVRVLAILCLVFIATSIILGINVVKTMDLANQVRANAAAAQMYTQHVVQHECQALELLTKTPVSAPANPAKNPSRVATYKFYVALLFWERSDGCRP